MMRDYYGAFGENWHKSPRLQAMHSLRGYSDDGVESLVDACNSIQDTILEASKTAVEFIMDGSEDEGYTFIGHAAHIIQDSFSAAHTNRSGSDLRGIEDICTYGRKFSGVCYHRDIEIGSDRVWKGSASCTFDPNARGMDCLKPVAVFAVKATAGYLVEMAHLLEDMSIVEPNLNRYFSEPGEFDLGGFLNCSTL
jgi:hypothetical protein